MYTRDSNGDATFVLNPDLLLWDTKDQALISMINATLSPLALALVIGQKSTKGVWDTLEKQYTSFSRSNILGLKHDLNNIKKSSDSIPVYMQKLKECKNKLEVVGFFIEDEKLLNIAVDGLATKLYPFYWTLTWYWSHSLGVRQIHHPIVVHVLMIMPYVREHIKERVLSHIAQVSLVLASRF